MIDANEFWLMMLCILGSILLVVLIVLSIKLVATVNKVNDILDDTSVKLSKVNGLFDTVDVVTDSLATASDKLVELITNGIKKLFSKKIKRKEEEDNEEK